MSREKILITGANGFVGKHLVSQLLQNNHQLVRCFRQINTYSPKPACRDVAITINSQSDWSEALVGVSHVVHCAAHVHVFQGDADSSVDSFREVNSLGTINLARQAAKAGVERFIFISTIGVNGNVSNDKPFNESDEPNPHNAYAQSKWEAEQALLDLADKTGMEVVIIRPPLIYGPHAPGNFASLLKVIKKGLPLPLKSVKNKRAFIGIDNLINFIQLSMNHPAAANQVFLVSDGEDISTATFIETIAAELGFKNRLFYFPATPVYLMAKLAGKSKMIEQLYGSLEADTTKARKLLSWKPKISLATQINKIRLNE